MEHAKTRPSRTPFVLLVTLLFVCRVYGQGPAITTFSPSAGAVGSTVSITGSNFSTTPANDIVYFGGVKAIVSSATVNSLSVTVPDGATPQPISVTVNGLTAYSSKPFTATFTGGSTALISSSFTNVPGVVTGLHPYGVVAADMDGDGLPDLVTPGNANSPSPSSVSILLNTGGMNFATEFDLPAFSGSNPYSIIAADIDGDGKLDIIFTCNATSVVSIYRNQSTPGTLSFAARVDMTTGQNPWSVAVGDLDGDGKPDLAVTNFLSNTVSLYKNTSSPGTVSFAPKMDLPTDLAPHSVAIGDLDGDGKPDLAVSNTFSSTISLFRNLSSPGAFNFALKVDVATGADEPCGVAIGDLDGDGKPDLALTNDNFNQTTQATVSLSLFRNTSTPGSLSFSTPQNYGAGDSYNVTIGDLNGDGTPDIAVATSTNGVVLYPNTSSSGTIALGAAAKYAYPGG